LGCGLAVRFGAGGGSSLDMDPPDGECWQAGEDVPEPDQPLGKVAPLGETEGPRDATDLDRPTTTVGKFHPRSSACIPLCHAVCCPLFHLFCHEFSPDPFFPFFDPSL